jgi:hypothetical protein
MGSIGAAFGRFYLAEMARYEEAKFVNASTYNLMISMARRTLDSPNNLSNFRQLKKLKEDMNLSSQEFLGLTEEELAQAVKLECKTAISIFLNFFMACMTKQQKEGLGFYEASFYLLSSSTTHQFAFKVFDYIKEAMKVGKVGFGDLGLSEEEFKELKNKIYFIIARGFMEKAQKYDDVGARKQLRDILKEIDMPPCEFLQCTEEELQKVLGKKKKNRRS